jgi:hypothetical protein
MARKYTKIHEPLLLSFLMKNFPGERWITNVRLGKIDKSFFPEATTSEMENLAKIYLPRADAVVLLKDKVILIEVTTRNEFWKLEQLEEYARQFRQTEEFKDWWHLPIEKWLITPRTNPYLEERAARYQIKVVVWSEPFWEYYAKELRGRDREGRFSGTVKPPFAP